MEASRIKTKIPRKHNEENAQYFFVLASFFEDDMVAQMDVKQIHQMLKYTMDSFVKFKGHEYVESISKSFEYFNIIKKKWMRGWKMCKITCMKKLSGKKTYFTAAAAIITALGAYFTGGVDLTVTIQSVFAALMVVFLRKGVTSEAAKAATEKPAE